MIKVGDTIFALATPYGVSGVGVVKISGPKALWALKKVFKSRRDPSENPRMMILGDVVDPETGDVLDRALSVYMPSPRSYTGEDVVEIQLHGGLYLIHTLLEILERIGLRAAGPGEFTLRAFLSGKLDLTQAEAILELVNAKTELGLKAASKVMKGELGRRVRLIKDLLKDALVEVEAQLDFPEDEVVYDKELVLSNLKKALSTVEFFLSSYDVSRVLREGVAITICGAPNVGKSSLFNRLIGEDRAIVTPVPGTTRDFLEGELMIGSVPVKVIDTAGIRAPGDPVEEEGVRRAREKVNSADLVIFVFDLSREPTKEEMEFASTVKPPCIKVGNKLDLFDGQLPGYIDVAVSAKTGEGIDELKNIIEEKVVGGKSISGELVLVSSRQKVGFEKARDFLLSALNRVSKDGELDLASEDIKSAISSMSEIIGEVSSEEILNEIFGRFCIGK